MILFMASDTGENTSPTRQRSAERDENKTESGLYIHAEEETVSSASSESHTAHERMSRGGIETETSKLRAMEAWE